MPNANPLITVVVVNDQRPVCKLWQQMIDNTPDMTCLGYAINGEDALNLVRETQPDIVLMDVLMPGMRGDEAMKQIHDEFPHIIVIMYSADQSTEKIARDANAIEFLLMPVKPSELTQTIRRIYSEHRKQV